MFDVFETDVVAADGVWAVTFERQPGLASWGDVAMESFGMPELALHEADATWLNTHATSFADIETTTRRLAAIRGSARQ